MTAGRIRLFLLDMRSDRFNRLPRPVVAIMLGGLLAALSGCIQVSTKPIRIEPIYIEITINHKIQRELDDIFADLDAASQTTNYKPLSEE